MNSVEVRKNFKIGKLDPMISGCIFITVCG